MCEKYCCDHRSVSPLAVLLWIPLVMGFCDRKNVEHSSLSYLSPPSLCDVSIFPVQKREKKSPRTMQHIIFHFFLNCLVTDQKKKNIWPYSQLYLSYWYFNLKNSKNNIIVIFGYSAKANQEYKKWIRISNWPIFRSVTVKLGLISNKQHYNWLSYSRFKILHSQWSISVSL